MPFAALNADSEVMKYFPALLDRATSDAMAKLCAEHIAERGWGFWAVETANSNEFIGFVGLNIPRAQFPFSPCVEIGWRLAKKFWGKGYATEAAKAALDVAFNQLKLAEVVAFTSIHNLPSQAVMQRIGMQRSLPNFASPTLSVDHRLSEHCLYRIRNTAVISPC